MIIEIILVVLGLVVFEVVSSVDNAIINAEVLSTMQAKARRWFLTWGMFFAVFLLRGLLPWLIVWLATPGLGPLQALSATFSSDPQVAEALALSSPILMLGGGVFLVFLFLDWLFLEEKNFSWQMERVFLAKGLWFYSVVSVLLCLLVWQALQIQTWLAFGAVVGSTAFFITNGFKKNAQHQEERLLKGGLGDMSKLVYLEVLDATFSIDGVLGAFAFTMAVPLILLGNGIGALVVRQLTICNIETLKQYRYLQNGAMYSIFFLGLIMILEGFHVEIPFWVSPSITFLAVGYFFWRSKKALMIS